MLKLAVKLRAVRFKIRAQMWLGIRNTVLRATPGTTRLLGSKVINGTTANVGWRWDAILPSQRAGYPSRLSVMAIVRDSRGLQSPRESDPNPLHDLSVLSADDAKDNLSK